MHDVSVWADRFEIQRTLGAGGMGVVYLAYDRSHDALRALKTLQHMDAQSLYAFKHEFRALADLHHPNLVQMWELLGRDNDWCFTMDYLDGENFSQFVRPDGDALTDATLSRPVDPDRTMATASPVQDGSSRARSDSAMDPRDDATVDFRGQRARAALAAAPREPVRRPGVLDVDRLRYALQQLAQGIDALHASRRIHRDIKPSNVIVTREETPRVVVLDFGLVTEHRAGMRSTWSDGQLVGTIPFMAPEQAAGARVEPAADWYSFGAMLFEALTGGRPFEGELTRVLRDKQTLDAPSPHERATDVPDDLAQLCSDLLRRDPGERPRGADVLARLGVAPRRTITAPSAPPAGLPDASSAGLVGREAERSAIERAFEAVRAGRGRTLVVGGAAGVGKTALVRQFLVESQRADPRLMVLAGRCYERESVPYKGFDSIVDALGQELRSLDRDAVAAMMSPDVHRLARIFPTLLRVEPIAERARAANDHGRPAPDHRARAFSALRRILCSLAADRPLVLFIDDLQWADRDSMALLEDLVGHEQAPAMLLLCTMRMDFDDASGHGSHALTDFFESAKPIERVELRNLAPEAARRLFARLWQHDGDEGSDALREVVRQAHGHPLLLQEIARYVADGEAAAPGSDAVQLDEVLWRRVRQLEPEPRRIVEFVAVAGAPVSLPLVADALGVPKDRARRAVEMLEAAKLLRTVPSGAGLLVEAFHDRIRESTVDHLAVETQRDYQSRLIDAYRSTEYADPDRVVACLEAAGRGAEAVHEALEAARRAEDALAFERTARLLTVALRHGAHTPDALRLLHLRIGNALSNAGRGGAAAEHFLAAAEGAAPADRRKRLRLAADALLGNGDAERGLRVLQTVFGEYGLRLPRSRTGLVAASILLQMRLRIRGLAFEARDGSQIPEAAAERLEVLKTGSRQLTFIDPFTAYHFRFRALLTALELGDRASVVEGVALESAARAARGGSAARRSSSALIAAAQGLTRTSQEQWFLRGCAAASKVIVGDFADAVPEITTVSAWLTTHGVGLQREMDNLHMWWMSSLRETGQWVAFRELLDRLLRDARRRGDVFVEIVLSRQANAAWLLRDAPDEAAAQIARLAWPQEARDVSPMHWYDLRARVEIALYRGTIDREFDALAARSAVIRASLSVRRVQMARVELRHLWGRMLLARASRVPATRAACRRMVAREIRTLRREDMDYAQLLAEVLEAGLAALGDDRTATVRALERVVKTAQRRSAATYEACALWRLGELRGGADATEARARFEQQQVANPERWLAVFLPWPATRRPDGA